MNLLPKSSEEFSSQEYWNAFFAKRKEDAFEWYGEYPELASLLHKYISPKDNLLIVGCGNSTLSADLHTAGIKNQKSLDISSVVVNQMRTKYPHVDFVEGDVTNMEFPDNGFSCILDKGTFDALSPPPQAVQKRNKTEENDEQNDGGEEKAKVERMMDEISRTLKPGGRFICVSLLQPHVASRLLSHFHKLGWIIRVLRCLDAEQKTAEKATEENAIIFPVFMTVFTKLTLPPGSKAVLEASPISSPSSFRRLGELNELMEFIKDQQNCAMVQRGLNQLGSCAEKGIVMTLSNATTGEDRFVLHLVDVPKLLNNPLKQKFGVFIVPQGRETEWLFGTHEGRMCLATQANFTRMIVVHLVRGQTYADMNTVQDEIRGPLANLSPLCVKEKNIKAPIMTVGNDVGSRLIIHQGRSDFSGDFVVEDVKCDDQILRRLIFLNNPNVIQSEVEMSIVRKRGKEWKVPKTSKLECQHHGLMTISFGFLKHFYGEDDTCPTSSMLIGLGGGLLASFLIDFMPHLTLTVVEIDPEIVTIAKNYFGLPENDRLKIEVNDGLKFIQSTESQYNVILIDVDNKSTKEGLSCPPPEFLDLRNLEVFKKIMNPKASVLVINLVCRNQELKKSYITSIHGLFPLILQYDVPQEVNTLLFCFPTLPLKDVKNIRSHISSAVKCIPETSESTKTNSKNRQLKNTSSDIKLESLGEIFNDIENLANGFKVLKV